MMRKFFWKVFGNPKIIEFPNISEIPGHTSPCCACRLFIFDAFCRTWSSYDIGVFIIII